ncbi:MAG: metallophosphoesterase [Pirellulales bacterium]|nr:metallophosphoesterase [Pirellulales bacterium]
MDRRDFLLVTGASLTLLGLGQGARADAPKKEQPVEKANPKAPPAPFVPGSWTLVILPDTQNYSTYYPGVLRLQMQWIVDNKDKRRIAYVLQNGDLTNRNSSMEWKRVDRAFRILDGVVPYAIVPGNHDYSAGGTAKDRSTGVNKCFPTSRFAQWPTFGGAMEPGHIENNYHLFEAGGRQWLVIGLEWGPRDEAVQWTDAILAKYPERKAIVFTHAYLYNDSTRYDWAAKGDAQPWNPHAYKTAGGVNDGEELWQKALRKHANVCLVNNGHVLGDGLGFQVSKGDAGNTVNEMLCNYQMKEIGGGGWLRLLEFLPDGKTVQAKTYSPLYEEYETSPDNQFTFTID